MRKPFQQLVAAVCCAAILIGNVDSVWSAPPTVDSATDPAVAPAVDPPTNPAIAPENLEFFEKQVRPLLIAHCQDCHGSDSNPPDGGLRLDSRQGLLAGGTSGAAIDPGQPERSRLVRAVRYADPLLQMPPDGKLSDREIATLVKWVELGAPDPRDEPTSRTAGSKSSDYPEDVKQWWAFQPVGTPAVPEVHDPSWPKNEIDSFILARLEAAGMSPAPAADRRSLIRRVTFDLIGLPPTPEDIDAFLSDESPDAFARVVDRLLDSPQYGQRWGRHWLDVVRYADTSGCNSDFPMPEAYRYRNYVIDSFNQDKPYDLFAREQIAGDLLAADNEQQRQEQIIATGYLAISRRFSSVAEEFHLTLDDTLDNVGKGLLGLTVSCARCHDHKFDPIPQADYYALYGIFESTKYAFPGTEIYRHPRHLSPLLPPDEVAPTLRSQLDRMEELDEAIYATYTRMAMLDAGTEKSNLRGKWQTLQKERDELVKELPDFPKAYGASEGTPVNSRIHIKGDPENLGVEVPRGSLQILGGQLVTTDSDTSGRLELAEWLTDPNNPLTARVMVNRVWLHHFGQGLVRTPDDFGTRSTPPTHPELLDFLTRQFIDDGWSIKTLHRRILLSQTWQMACVENDQYARHDSENELYWTFNRRRLSAEELRDSLLLISGELDMSPGGPHPFKPEIEWRYSQHRPFVDDFPSRRRTVYLMQQRFRQQPYLGVFDGADTNAATGLRKVSTTPQQALFQMNSEFVDTQARVTADRLGRETSDPRARIGRAFLLALGRPATSTEIEEGLDYLGLVAQSLPDSENRKNRDQSAWASYLRVLLSCNEFVFVD
jgi:hypothetical protein